LTGEALVWLKLRWPREVTEPQMTNVWRRLPAIGGWPLIIEAIGQDGTVRHRLGVTASREVAITRHLRAELPGIGVDQDDSEPLDTLGAAGEIRFTTRRRAVQTDDLGSASRALLTALAVAQRDEVVMLEWVLGRPLHAQATPSGGAPLSPESWLSSTWDAFTGTSRPNDNEPRRALATKQGEPGWRAVGRIAVKAATAKRRIWLLRYMAGALRSLETPGLHVLLRRQRPGRAQRVAIPRLRWPLRLNAFELAALSSWPVGMTQDLPVEALHSRQVAATAAIPRRGRVVAEAAFPGAVRPLALTGVASTRHLHLLGPSGSGKSTLMHSLIAQDLAAGAGLIVIEPRGDLIADVLASVPAERLNDVVLLDPTDSDRPVGLNPLMAAGRPPELVADQLLGTFHSLYAHSWGVRTADILGAALLTLVQVPGMSLVAVPLLLTNAGFRRRVLSQINDPVGLGPFWAGFEAWSEAERTTATAPVLNKLRPFLMRSSLRRLLGQAEPRFDLRQVFTRRKVLLCNLAVGQLGPEMASLIGALVLSQAWQAAQGRSTIERTQRRPVFLYIDEFQNYLHLPVDLGDMLVQARGLGLCLTVAHQHLGQLSSDMRTAVLANAGSKVAFRTAAEDGRIMAAGSRLTPEDFSGLGAYECYVQLVADGAVQPWASGRSLPPPEGISDPEIVRAASRANYGRDRTEIDQAIERLMNGDDALVDDLTPRRRGGRS
jgi:hypothetical protein